MKINNFIKNKNYEIGKFKGGKKEIKPITISTYDSVYIKIEEIGNKFGMIIADEVHHLAAKSYINISELFPCINRMGLTTTFYRSDNRHKELYDSFGNIVYNISKDELNEKGYIADCKVEKIKVELTEEERKKYDKNMEKFKKYLSKNDYDIDYQDIILKSGTEKEAWNALQGYKKAKKIAFNSKNKIRKLQKILKNLKNEKEDNKIIIFCRYNDTVKKISDKFLILHITHKTDKEERKEIMKKFKNGKYNSIVSAQILEEGVDVSSANIGIILSGTGSPRELIQRIGRILRPDGKIARIYEIISSKTNELNVRNKRWKKI